MIYDNTILLVHNYQPKEIQIIADFIGDSLALCKKAKELSNVKNIIFAGVRFMAENAKILNPSRNVFIPDKSASCPMAEMADSNVLQQAKRDHPNVPIVAYVNSTAIAKTFADVCCTSTNAVNIVKSINNNEVILTPDKNLANWVGYNITEKKIYCYPENGHCFTHDKLKLSDVLKTKELYPNSILISHPECDLSVLKVSDYVESTEGMIKRSKEIQEKEIIIATEVGMIERLRREVQNKIFHPASESLVCKNHKKTTIAQIQDIVNGIKKKDDHKLKQYEIDLEEQIIRKAKQPIENMLKMNFNQ